MASTPASCAARATLRKVGFSDDHPRRNLRLTGTETAAFIAATISATRVARRSSAAPKPRFVASWIGQPRLMSTKSAPDCSAIRAASAISSGFLPASWTPKNFSEG